MRALRNSKQGKDRQPLKQRRHKSLGEKWQDEGVMHLSFLSDEESRRFLEEHKDLLKKYG